MEFPIQISDFCKEIALYVPSKNMGNRLWATPSFADERSESSQFLSPHRIETTHDGVGAVTNINRQIRFSWLVFGEKLCGQPSRSQKRQARPSLCGKAEFAL